MDTLTQLALLTLAAGTPLVFAALGELVVEKSGVLNLGVEGMMLVGAVVSFIVAARTQSPWLGVAAGATAAAALSVIFAVIARRDSRTRKLTSTSAASRNSSSVPWKRPVTADGRPRRICADSPPR